jgi:hypothetical protein
MRYTAILEHGGWVVWDTIRREIVTHPATSEEAQEACSRMNSQIIARPVDPPVQVDGWGPLGDLTLWVWAEGAWWGHVAGKQGVRWIRAEDTRPS